MRRLREGQAEVLRALEQEQEAALCTLRGEAQRAQRAAVAAEGALLAARAQHTAQLREQQQRMASELAAQRAQHAAHLQEREAAWAAAAAEAATQHAHQQGASPGGGATPSPLQRRFQQRLAQVGGWVLLLGWRGAWVGGWEGVQRTRA